MRLRRALRHQGRADDGLDRRGRRELGGADRAGARARRIAIGTPGHSWQITAQGKSGQAKKGMVNAAKVMAGVAVDALGDPALIARAKADHKARTEVTPYDCPLPADVKPPIQPRGRREGSVSTVGGWPRARRGSLARTRFPMREPHARLVPGDHAQGGQVL